MQTEMVAHLIALRITVADKVSANGLKGVGGKVVDAQVGGPSDHSTCGEFEVGREGLNEHGEDVLWLPGAWNTLVEVAKQHSGQRTVALLKNRAQVLEVGLVIFPRLAVTLAGADMSIAPRDAYANKPSRTERSIGSSSDEAAWRK